MDIGDTAPGFGMDFLLGGCHTQQAFGVLSVNRENTLFI